MQVQSAYASGMQGLQSAQQGLAQATTAVAIPDQQKPAVSASTQDTVTLSSQAMSQSDQTSALIDATQSVNQAQASTKVIEAASETVGSLIDIEV
ncbi:chemotaxis protein [Shewanella phaeophyticola]|uniref:Chemotaxis protein n=1 Tax=Shewanella phaeophyticola TaxID=2978345 RepID=A0ABT2P658_9GAMM|nr:chemotaxis protein [Shewanella sp. KJ10-1]MCT8986726.1 chemotaxis protein [Shewanella sp. KJ10-1]